MSVKTITMVALAAMGLAAHASGVIEVKFSVRTDDAGRVTTKKIYGVCDTQTGKHTFWTGTGKNKQVINGTYFGLMNDTTVKSKFGQNAELIWGNEENPENVIVAGAWGSAKSRSGNAAGMIGGKPATGSWSVKVNQRSSYEELLAKNKVTQTENRSEGVITGLADTIEKSLEEIAAVKEQAAKDVADAQAKAEADVAAAKEQGAKAVADAQAKAEADVAAAKEQADAAIKAAEEQAAAQIAAKQEELNQINGELEATKGALDELVENINELDDPEMYAQLSIYLADKEEQALRLKTESQAVIDLVEQKYADYEQSLDREALKQAIASAEDALGAEQDELDARTAALKAAATTNKMMTVINEGRLQDYYYSEQDSDGDGNPDGLIPLKQQQIDNNNELLENAENNLPALVEQLRTATNNLTVAVANWSNRVNTLQSEVEDKKAEYDEAKAKLDAFVQPQPGDGVVMTYDEYVESHDAELAGKNDLEKQQAYDAYVAQAQADARTALENAAEAARQAYADAVGNCEDAEEMLKEKSDLLANRKEALETIETTGQSPAMAKIKERIALLEEQKAALEADYEFWKSFRFSDDDKHAVEQQVIDARAAVQEQREVVAEAQTKLDEARDALANIGATQSARLNALTGAMGLADGAFDGLDIEDIRKKVDEFEAEYKGYVEKADAMIKAIDSIKDKIVAAE